MERFSPGRLARRSLAGAVELVPSSWATRFCDLEGLTATLLEHNFDQDHYERFAGRRFKSRRMAGLHYLLIGSEAGWEPRPDFSPAYYRTANPDVVIAGYEPFAHYCTFGRFEGRGALPAEDEPDDRDLQAPSLEVLLAHRPPARNGETTLVIMPVFGNRALTLRAIDRVLSARTDRPFEFIVIDDASQDEELSLDLRQLAHAKLLTLLVNVKNEGFVVSANRGLRLHGGRDVVLLNSDTAVFDGWLDRLLTALRSAPNIGTVTPLSNAATILSYPLTLRDYDCSDMDYSELDRSCAGLGIPNIEIPTGIGFCMAIRGACLDQVGYFDEHRFGRGYGEENDLCLRASARGWIHVAATDVFVWHRGGGSFKRERAGRIAAAQSTLERIHPGYRVKISEFIAADRLRPVREALDIIRVARDGRRKILSIGGTDRSIAPGGICLRLIEDFGRFRNYYRVAGGQQFPLANLPRLDRNASLQSMQKLLADLRIDEIRAVQRNASLTATEQRVIEAGKAQGLHVFVGAFSR